MLGCGMHSGPKLAFSTCNWIFFETHLFVSVWVPVHTETAFLVTECEAFRKRSPEWIFLKTPRSCCRVDGCRQTELFENADMTISIYFLSLLEHELGSLGIMRGHFACLFSFIEVRMPNRSSIMEFRYRISHCEYHSVFVWTGIFSKTLLV